MPPPIVARYHGQVIECHAGRCFARFAESADAIAAAIALQLVVSNMPHTAPDEQPLHITCGIDFGRFLCVDERHVFGTPVSRAQQLGPGVAKVEILAK